MSNGFPPANGLSDGLNAPVLPSVETLGLLSPANPVFSGVG